MNKGIWGLAGLLALIVLVSGCTSDTSANQQVLKPLQGFDSTKKFKVEMEPNNVIENARNAGYYVFFRDDDSNIMFLSGDAKIATNMNYTEFGREYLAIKYNMIFTENGTIYPKGWKIPLDLSPEPPVLLTYEHETCKDNFFEIVINTDRYILLGHKVCKNGETYFYVHIARSKYNTVDPLDAIREEFGKIGITIKGEIEFIQKTGSELF